jgi:hypothetical protein
VTTNIEKTKFLGPKDAYLHMSAKCQRKPAQVEVEMKWAGQTVVGKGFGEWEVGGHQPPRI